MRRTGQLRWTLATGLAAGLALLSKFTALFLVPLTLLWTATFVLTERRHTWQAALGRLGVVWALAGAVVVAGYQFQPMLFLKGIRYQMAVSQGEWTGYLMGEVSQAGWLHYFLVAVLVKVPVPALVVCGLAVFARWRGSRRLDVTTEVILLSTAGLFFVYLSLFNRLNIGLRYLLPAFPFMLVGMGQAARFASVCNVLRAESASDRPGRGARSRSRLVEGAPAPRGATAFLVPKLPLGNAGYSAGSLGWWLKTAVFALLVAWQIVSVGRVAPHYLAYFNEIAGGPEHGAYWLGDSNLDWGQDLKGLAKYVESHDLAPVCVRYFGTMPPEIYGLEPCGDEPLEEGTIQAVSVSLLQGLYLDDPKRFEHLWAEDPIATIGHTIRLYRTTTEIGD
jgi:4-amino-4-deoxy-L-arabinose transferase-like glycosyltransferase